MNSLAQHIATALGALGLIGTPIVAAGTVPTEHNAFIGYIVLTGLTIAVSVSSIATGIVMRRAANRPVALQQPVITELKKEMATREEIAAQRRYTGHVRDALEKEIKEGRAEARDERRRMFAKLNAIAERLATMENEAANLREAVRETNRRIT